MMNNHAQKKHSIDTLFPITLFLVLTILALLVIALAAKVYENTAENSHRNHQSRIALSYISEKVHQAGDDCVISIDQLDHSNVLTFEQLYEGSKYHTYIYYYDGALRELFVRDDVNFSLSDGKIILKLQEFSMQTADEGLLYFSCTDHENQTADSYVSIPD